MATDLRRLINLQQSSIVNPLSSAYWGTGGYTDGGGSLGNGDGTGFFPFESLAGLGYDVSSLAGYNPGGDANFVAASPDAYFNFLQSNGLSLREQNTDGAGSLRYMTDQNGGLVGEPVYNSFADPEFQAAMAAAAATMTGGAASAAGFGSAATGALSGGVGGFMRNGSLEDALKGAAIGGTVGGLRDYFGAVGGIDPAASDYGYTNQMDASSDLFGQQINLPSGWGNVPLPAGYEDAMNWQPQELGSAAGQSITDAATGAPLDQFVINGGGTSQLGGMQGLTESPGLSLPNMQVPNYGQQIGDQFSTLPQTNLIPSGPFQMPSVGNVPAAPAAAAGAGGLLSQLTGLTPGQLLGGAAAVGAVAGAQETPGQTQTTQSRTDPRFDPYLYGSGGLLESARNTFQQNQGPNAAMQAGWSQQLGLLNDQNVQSQLERFRAQGAGLLGSVAQNPFTTGQARLFGG